MDIRFLDVSAVLGLCAMVTLTVNVLIGMLLSTAYKTHKLWKRLPPKIRAIRLLGLHNKTAYLALVLVLAHPVLLLLDAKAGFTLPDVIVPMHAPKQNLLVTLGILAMLALVLVIITTQKRVKKLMTFRTWKNIHLISYGTAMLFIIHGLLMDPELQDHPIDWLDGEKLLCEVCLAVLLAATYLRVKWQMEKRGRKAALA